MNEYITWKTIRENNNLSQGQLALKFGVTKQMISSFEKGKSQSKPLQKKYLKYLVDENETIKIKHILKLLF